MIMKIYVLVEEQKKMFSFDKKFICKFQQLLNEWEDEKAGEGGVHLSVVYATLCIEWEWKCFEFLIMKIRCCLVPVCN